jgi:hypothetical protein
MGKGSKRKCEEFEAANASDGEADDGCVRPENFGCGIFMRPPLPQRLSPPPCCARICALRCTAPCTSSIPSIGHASICHGKMKKRKSHQPPLRHTSNRVPCSCAFFFRSDETLASMPAAGGRLVTLGFRTGRPAEHHGPTSASSSAPGRAFASPSPSPDLRFAPSPSSLLSCLGRPRCVHCLMPACLEEASERVAITTQARSLRACTLNGTALAPSGGFDARSAGSAVMQRAARARI